MTDIDAQIAALEAEAERALDLASATALGKAPPAGFRLTTCAEFRAIQQELEPLRAARAAAQIAPPQAARQAPPISRPAPMTDTRTDAEKIRAIAAGFPVPIPAGMVDAAITSGQAVDVFAIAAADYAAAGRAKLSHEAEVTAVVARILGHAPSAYSTPVKEPVPDTRTEDEVVADILRDGVPERERRT